MIGLGMKVQFIPAIVPIGIMPTAEKKNAAIVGTVVYINNRHRYFTAEYDCGDTKQRESFNFCDIGEAVTVIG